MLEDIRGHSPKPTATEEAWMAKGCFASVARVAAIVAIALVAAAIVSDLPEGMVDRIAMGAHLPRH